MAKRNSEVPKYVALVVILALLSGFVWWGVNLLADTTAPVVDRVSAAEEEIQALEDRINALETRENIAAWASVAKWLIIALGLSIPIGIWLHSKGKQGFKTLTIEESEKRVVKLMKEKHDMEVLDVRSTSHERREGRGKIYVHACQLTQADLAGFVDWHGVQHILVAASEPDHSLWDNIPRGLSTQEVITRYVKAFDDSGLPVQRDEISTGFEDVLERSEQFRRAYKRQEDVLETLGVVK